MRWRAVAAMIVGVAVAALPLPVAAMPEGSGVLTGTQRLRVKGCGKDTQPFTISLALDAVGDWSGVEGPRNFSGVYTPNAKGNRADLFFDGVSEALFVDQMESWAGILCNGTVVADTATRRKGRLAVKARKGTAKLTVKYKFVGTGPGGSGRATYKFKVTGAWTPVP
ncbi:MAG TPA: hypothetical protein VIT93_02405 [Dehalococcoidia bacterium]